MPLALAIFLMLLSFIGGIAFTLQALRLEVDRRDREQAPDVVPQAQVTPTTHPR
ncbi:MAG: hypothetical protein ABW154_14225 [Dyella sp.]